MKRTARTIALAAAVLVLASTAAGAPQRRSPLDPDMRSFKSETIAKTLAFADPAKPCELVVDNLYGPIKIEAYSGREVVLEAKRIVYARDEARAAKADSHRTERRPGDPGRQLFHGPVHYSTRT